MAGPLVQPNNDAQDKLIQRSLQHFDVSILCLCEVSMTAFLRSIGAMVLTLNFASCGGGGAGPGSVAPVDPNKVITVGNLKGKSCAVSVNTDVLGGLNFVTSMPINAKDYGCLIVDKADSHPVWDGNESARFEVRPGDCSADSGFNDCTNDRSRHEIREISTVHTDGSTYVYTTRIYIPTQTRFKPPNSALFLTQINFVDEPTYGTLVYLLMAENNNLMLRTHQGFTWNVLRDYPVSTSPYDKWIKLSYEIRASSGAEGRIKVFADDVLVVDETRPTLPTATAQIRLKLGIYNAFKSWATLPFETQYMYFDGISRTQMQ